METTFTPWASLGGGALIGVASVLLMLTLGRIMGATGVLTGVIFPNGKADFSWRAALILGMITAPLLMLLTTGSFPEISVPVTTPMMIIGGIIVGIGVVMGGGCTSGHGICGNARLAPRSMVATVTFMITTVITVYIVRHVLGA